MSTPRGRSLAPPPLSEASLRAVRVPVAIVSGEADVFLPLDALRRGAKRLLRAEVLLETLASVDSGRSCKSEGQ